MKEVSRSYVEGWQLVYCYGHGGYFWRPWSLRPVWNTRTRCCSHPPVPAQ